MKKIVLLLAVLICIVIGCTNTQSSSLEEAKYVASQRPDFGSFVQAISVSSGRSLDPAGNDPFLWQTEPKMEMESGVEVGNRTSSFVHLVIYEARYYPNTSSITTTHEIQKKTADKKYCLLILNDERPPKIVAKKFLFSETVLIDK